MPKTKQKKISISKEIGLKKKPSAQTAPAARPVKYASVVKTEKSLATIGSELVNIGSNIGGRRFLKIWALLSLIFAIVSTIAFPTAWTAANIAASGLFGDKMYFFLMNFIISVPTLFIMAFIPMMFLIIASHYIFVNWKLPIASRSKMSCELRTSFITAITGGVLFGIVFHLLGNVIPSSIVGAKGIMATLNTSLMFMVGLFFICIILLSLYKELTYMLGKK